MHLYAVVFVSPKIGGFTAAVGGSTEVVEL